MVSTGSYANQASGAIVAPFPPMVPKPDTNICLTARNFSVLMSADLWGISHPDTMDTVMMNGQAVWPLRARERRSWTSSLLSASAF